MKYLRLWVFDMITIKSSKEIEYMRSAGKIVFETHELIKKLVKPGITTLEIDSLAEDYIRKSGGIPSFKGYNGYPASICTSVNNQVVHGIPSLEVLKVGDIISVDIGVCYKGYHGDAARTYPVGVISESAGRLIRITRESFYKGIEYALEGYRLFDISAEIQKYVESNGYSIVREYVGHGIGRNIHEDPQIPNYGEHGRGPRLKAGMTLAIEPMVNMKASDVSVMSNKWTVVTKDGGLSAHYEHTVLITKGNPELLTDG